MKVLNLEEFDAIVAELKHDLQHEANQWVHKRDVHAAAASLASIEAVERLAHRVDMRAFFSAEPQEAKPKKRVLFHRRTKKQLEEAGVISVLTGLARSQYTAGSHAGLPPPPGAR